MGGCVVSLLESAKLKYQELVADIKYHIDAVTMTNHILTNQRRSLLDNLNNRPLSIYSTKHLNKYIGFTVDNTVNKAMLRVLSNIALEMSEITNEQEIATFYGSVSRFLDIIKTIYAYVSNKDDHTVYVYNLDLMWYDQLSLIDTSSLMYTPETHIPNISPSSPRTDIENMKKVLNILLSTK